MRFVRLSSLLLVGLALPSFASAQEVVKAPLVVLDGVPFSIQAAAQLTPVHLEVRDSRGTLLGQADAAPLETASMNGLVVTERSQLPLTLTMGTAAVELKPTFMPGWFSLIPPLVAIILALVFREV